MPPARDQVFISYSHKDKRWRDDLDTHLKPYLRGGSIVSWSDQEIAPGSKWFREIQSALMNSKIAVLLVSPDFFGSDFIHQHELGPFLKNAEQGGVKILWVPVRDSGYKQTALKNYQALLDPAKPLAGMTKAKRDQAWVKICEEIQRAANNPTETRNAEPQAMDGLDIPNDYPDIGFFEIPPPRKAPISSRKVSQK
jgi:internalin A